MTRRLLLAAFALLFSAAPAWSTTMLAFDTPALTARSSVVAVVDVLSLSVKRSGGRLATVAQLQVSRAVKGTRNGEALAVIVPGGTLGEWVQQVEGAPQLAEGETCVVFLEPGPPGLWQFVGLEQGHLAIHADRSAPGGWVVSRVVSARLVVPGSLQPAPAPALREPLLPLLERLDRLAGAGR